MNLPPCVKAASLARDADALDEIFAYLNTYATREERDAVLWTIGYYDLTNYNQRKLTAEAQISSAGHFPCTPFEKPKHLSKYCQRDKCPLKDPATRVRMMIKSIRLEPSELPLAANMVVELRNGKVFVLENQTFIATDAHTFFQMAARRFIDWFSRTHKGYQYPDILGISEEALATIFEDVVYSPIEGVGENEHVPATVRC